MARLDREILEQEEKEFMERLDKDIAAAEEAEAEAEAEAAEAEVDPPQRRAAAMQRKHQQSSGGKDEQMEEASMAGTCIVSPRDAPMAGCRQ